MKKPEMILFDYGHTLLYEPGFDPARCEEAIFPYLVKNPQALTPKQVSERVQELFGFFQEQSEGGMEIHEWQFMRIAYESLGLEFSLSYPELEEIAWNAASEGAKMPHVEEMLRFLKESGIRTGVISNICWSGQALARRINRLLPENTFEFIMASSEYALRKPHRLLFEAALWKAGLPAEQVWYCGDGFRNDVKGAHGAGIFPVLYRGDTPEGPSPYAGQREGKNPDFPYLQLHDWRELIEVLKTRKD